MRCFIGLKPNLEAREALAAIRDRAAELDIGARPVLTDNFHLTLVFIGDIQESIAAEIAQSLTILPEVRDQMWEIDRSGSFPRSKVCWVSGPNNPYLNMYSEQCRRLLTALDVPFDAKSFKAHVTILKQSRLEAPLVLKPIYWKIGRPELFVSARDSKGILRYTPYQPD